MADRALRVRWEGTQFVHHSLAIVNREICSRLLDRGVELSLRLYEPHRFEPDGDPRLEALAARFEAPLSGPADVEVRHRWPPRFGAATEGRLVLIQPWEFGAIPAAWLTPLRDEVDEVWVPTRYVRDCFQDSGADARRVRVIPNGVDTERFRPDVTPLPLATERRHRLLFVGGTIGRKGVRGLLAAYRAAFGPQDDVCLVIKDFGGDSVYAGKTAREEIRAAAADPAGPEILHLDATISDEDMPRLFAACDVLVHPYLGEGFGLPIAEAMAMEMPVVVTGLGAALDFVDERVGWTVPATRRYLPEDRVGELETSGRPWVAEPDLEALGRLMREALASPGECRRRGRAGRVRVLERMSWDVVADRVRDRLEELARPRRVPALR
ncbi:MAG: glycosyltransferase family 4 protein [Planctomycetota bacterium]